MTLKQSTRQLWRTCFDDTDAFVDLYFEWRYSDDINQVMETDGQVVAALQAVPYGMTFGAGREVPVAYISGACTHPDYRCRGWMRRLLTQTHRHLYEQQKLFSTLIPAHDGLKGYYARSGYAVCFYRDVKTIVINSYEQPVDNYSSLLSISDLSLVENVDNAVYSFFHEQLLRRPCTVLHTADDLQLILRDLALSGGRCLRIDAQGCLVGLAFCVPGEGDEWVVKELVGTDTCPPDVVLQQVGRVCRAGKVTGCLPPSVAPREWGMARVIRVEEALGHYARLHPSGTWLIQLTGDTDLPENNGYYRLSGGRCRRGFLSSAEFQTFTVPQLTAWLLEGLSPFMSLMLD